jgi:3-hydroxyacyl-CoA dehydrogenase
MTGKEDSIQKAVVIGAGAMGSGIAAQLANAGVSVYMLDVVPRDVNPEDPSDRNRIAIKALERMLKASPATDPLNAGFMVPENAKLVTPGNITDHLEEAVRDADWIVEAVIENIDVKRDLFSRLEVLMKPTAVVSSNTSTIPLWQLVEGRADAFRRRFVITHFFNPPRFMHLLEIVAGSDTDADVPPMMEAFGDIRLGKNVIHCKDTPAFLANRVGIYYMFRAITEAVDRNMRIDEADAVLGTPVGFPKEGIFGLLDLVGIGIIPLVTESLLKTLDADDPFRQQDHNKGLDLVRSLLEKGCWGRNSPKGGFYRMQRMEGGKKQKQAVNLETGEYYDVGKLKLASVKASKTQGPRAVLTSGDALGDYAWVVVRDVLLYSAWLLPEIADDLADIDASLRGGYNAKWGPFELMDQLGVDWFCSRVEADGLPLPPALRLAANRPFYRVHNGQLQRLVFDFEAEQADYATLENKPGVIRLEDIRRQGPPLLTHYSASLWDIGDGVACLAFHSKMNTLDPSVLWVVNQTIAFMGQHADTYRALVIYNDEKNFSLGANLGLLDAGFQAARTPLLQACGLSGLMENVMYQVVDAMIVHGQSVFNALRKAPFPVVGAPHGMALGGGCEILLHCDAIQASAETYMGLVESGVGVIPGWGGCVRYLERSQGIADLQSGRIPAVRHAFQTLLMPQFSVSTSAQDARKKHWLRSEDGITMNPDRLLADAKTKALSMVDGYSPPESVTFALPGQAGKSALNMAVDDFYVKGQATYHDVVVADALADVLTGGPEGDCQLCDEQSLALLERQHFLSLMQTEQTKKRIAHTLKTGKPLRESPEANGETVEVLRASRQQLSLKPYPFTGNPLDWVEAFKLKLMADVSAFLLKQV